MDNFSPLLKRIDYNFKNADLLKQSLVHRSYLNEHPDFQLGHNERLEFLGDAVLEIVSTEFLYRKFPTKSEGELTDWRAGLVNTKMLSEVANNLGLDDYLFLSKGEAKDKNTKARQIILANAVEAVIGALYLDGGLKAAKAFIKQEILSQLNRILVNDLYIDPKSKFQEKAQELYGITPRYEVLKESGPDHDKTFKVGLYIEKDQVAAGSGSSKHEAQVAAASAGLKAKGW